jgi:hypothetical protein
MAFVVSTVFWREDKNTEDDGNLFLGVVFYSELFMLLSGISEMHLLVARLRCGSQAAQRCLALVA